MNLTLTTTAAPSASVAPSAAAAIPRLRVLVVDDEPHVQEGLKLNLGRSFDVMTAGSGAQGLELLHQHPDVAVVISDMCMPAMDGVRFLRLAQKVAPLTARILLTGYADMAAAVDAVNQGQICSFLLKPCPPDRLVDTVAAAAHLYRQERVQEMLIAPAPSASLPEIFEQAARLFACRYAALHWSAPAEHAAGWTLTHGLRAGWFDGAQPRCELVERLQRGETLALFAPPGQTLAGLPPEHPAVNQLVGVPLFGPAQRLMGWLYFADDRRSAVVTPEDARVAGLVARLCAEAAAGCGAAAAGEPAH